MRYYVTRDLHGAKAFEERAAQAEVPSKLIGTASLRPVLRDQVEVEQINLPTEEPGRVCSTYFLFDIDSFAVKFIIYHAHGLRLRLTSGNRHSN